MAQRALIIGIPGAGKTHRAMEVSKLIKDRGFPIQAVGFSTFTRAARREAAQRAAEAFGVPIETLEKTGWFRTIHSAINRLLKPPRGSIVNYDTDWLREVMGDKTIEATGEEDGDGWSDQWRGKSPIVSVLQLWDVARNRLEDFHHFYEDLRSMTGEVPLESVGDAEDIIDRYERAKQRDGRLDFCDLVMKYAGFAADIERGFREVEPEGDSPNCVAYIFDEAQDTSPLLDRAAQRLSRGARWLYLMGDPNQGIYTWAGADHKAFTRWPMMREEYLTKSYRCSAEVLQLGLRLLYNRNPDSAEFKSLQFEPRCPGGNVIEGWESDLLDHVEDPHRSTLIMARTNAQARDIQAQLSCKGIPWKSVRSGARWPPLAKTRTADAFHKLASDDVLDADEWRRIVLAVPVELLERGTRTLYREPQKSADVDFVTLASMMQYGGTEALREYILNGHWHDSLKPEENLAFSARSRWGDLIDDPKVIVSTIHGTKGMQADRVILATRIGGPVIRALHTPQGQEEERRVWYVGLTRARDDLILLKGRGSNYKEIYDCI